MFSASRQAWLDGARSVTLAYFANDPFRNDGSRYPLSLVGFWLEIYNFVNGVVDPWNRSVGWLRRQRTLPSHIRRTIEDHLDTLNWDDYIQSFTVAPKISSLATLLSDDWLDDNHVTLLTDLFDATTQDHLTEDGLPPVIAVPPDLTHQIIHRHTLPYPLSPRIADLAEFIHTGDVTQFAFIAHVHGNHWTAVSINLLNQQMAYGDSMGGSIPDVLHQGLQGWIMEHGGPALHVVGMKVVPQHDTYNCGPFAWKALMHHHFPFENPLPKSDGGSLIRAEAFIEIAKAQSLGSKVCELL